MVAINLSITKTSIFYIDSQLEKHFIILVT